MSVDFSAGSPFANALQGVVQPKLAEYGWTTGDPEDSTIFEYILLMLGNNKDENTIASELSNDLLDLGPENVETQQFARWLFEQIEAMTQQANGGNPGASQSNDTNMDTSANDGPSAAQDMDMDDTTGSAPSSIPPTGPKAMRNGSGSKNGRGGRMLNNLNKQMDNDAALHRVRGSAGSGRINSHSREPPKGPRGQNIGRGMAALANGRGMGNVGMNMSPGGMNNMAMNPVGMPMGMPMPPMGQNGMLNPQQQMALMQMYEQQAQMMQQIFSGQSPQPFVNPNFPHNNRKNNRPLSERVDKSRGSKSSLPQSAKFSKKDGDDAMTDTPNTENGDSAMDMEGGGRPDPSNTMCKFNLRCTNPKCHFVHQSPAAPDGTPVDMNDTCSYGAKCTNKKCVGKHPSPAQRAQFQAEKECQYYPNCTNMNCPFSHPTVAPCRNGADCTTPNCKFWHNSVMCRFNPCTNWQCPYKHIEGQKKTSGSNKWVAKKEGDEEKEHVSERKFINEDVPEERILPGQPANEDVEVTT